MASVSLVERDQEIPKPGYYFTKPNEKTLDKNVIEVICYCDKYGVYLIGSEHIYSFENFEYFKNINSDELNLWLESVYECSGMPEYRAGALAVAEFTERLRKHKENTQRKN